MGWTVSPVLVTEHDYRIAHHGQPGPGSSSAGFDAALAAMAFGTVWAADLLVGDLEAALQRAASAGSEQLRPATEVPHMGSQALLRDPTGLPMRFWSPSEGSPALPALAQWNAVPYFEAWSSAPEVTIGFLQDALGVSSKPDDRASPVAPAWLIGDDAGPATFVVRAAADGPGFDHSLWVPFLSAAAVVPCLMRAVQDGGSELPRHPPSGASGSLRLGWCLDLDGLPVGFAARH